MHNPPHSNGNLPPGSLNLSEWILQNLFDWIEIPAGQVTLTEDYLQTGYLTKGDSKTFDVATFQIAKYPTTNIQYEQFLAADGYSNSDYWTDTGWQIRTDNNWIQPRYYDDYQHDYPQNGSKHPVVGVSWYEAYAFTRWLSVTTGETIMLPTEQQWQRAAGGDEGLVYPWGNEWDADCCNHWIGNTDIHVKPVTTCEGKGDSPFGVVDMIGNTWEWCLTGFSSGTTDSHSIEKRVYRSCSWWNTRTTDFRTTRRNATRPEERSDTGGFRCVRLYR